MTIANSLQFYTDKPLLPSIAGKIGELGLPHNGEGVGRFYFTSKHLEALYAGLKILKPSYKTIDQLKKERNFKGELSKIKKQESGSILTWHREYRSIAEEQRHKRRQYLKSCNKEYKKHIEYQLATLKGRLEYLTRDGVRPAMYSQIYGSEHIEVFELVSKQRTDLALASLRKNIPLKEFKTAYLGRAPKSPPRSIKRYVDQKMKDLIAGEQQYGSVAKITV